MAIRLNRFLLGLALLAATVSNTASAQEAVLDDIITPDLERRTIKEGDIDTENFEVGLFTGIINIEDFGSDSVSGVRIAYHLTDLLFFEFAGAQSRLNETSFERLSGDIQLLTDDQRDVTYYNASLGIKILPGEVFIGKNFAANTHFYIIGGLGNTDFADEQHFTYNLGFGFAMLPTDWLSVRVDVRDHLLKHDLFGESVNTNNIEASFGLSIYF